MTSETSVPVYDVKIENATIIDGTGANRYLGEIGIAGGRLRELGNDVGKARHTFDAEGLVAAPGFVDVHTHLDAQAFFDPMFSVSSWHGVTSVIAGNCGFGIAPTRPDFREIMMRSLENVEGMSYDCLREGLGEWDFVSFPEYLQAVERRGVGLNFAAYVGHTPVRLFVMGEDATERSASSEEIDSMADIVRQALDAGAIGFSTSKVPSHVVWDGRQAPSRKADFDEILALAEAMADTGKGVFMCALGAGLSVKELEVIAERTRRPVTFAGILTDMGGPGGHRRLLERLDRSLAEGHDITAQISTRPLTVEFSLLDPYMFTNGAPAVMRLAPLEAVFQSVYMAPSFEDKLAVYKSDAFRQEFRAATDGTDWVERVWRHMIVLSAPHNRSLEQSRVLDLASNHGCTPADVILDLGLDSRLEARFSMAYMNTDAAELAALLKHRGTQIGLSDSGAHLNQICDACFPTDFLGTWVRERQTLSLEEAVAMLTSRPADAHGLAGRGRLQPGYAADVVVFDPDTVAAAPLRRVYDFPADTPRLVSDALGVRAVLVNGVPIRENDEYTLDPANDRLPGQVIRSERSSG